MPGRLDQTRPFLPVNIAILTVSDTRAAADDKSGNALAELLGAPGTASSRGASCATTRRRSWRSSAPGSPTPRSTW